MVGQLTNIITPSSALVGIVCGLVVYLLTKKRYKLPPAPFEWPLIGNLKVMKSKFWFEVFAEYTKVLGPVFRIKLGLLKMVILNDLQSVQEVLVTKSGDFADRMNTTSTYEISEGMKDIAFANYTPAWKLHRRLASKALRQYLKGDHLNNAIEGAMTKVIDELKKETEPFHPQKLIDFGVFSISCSLCFNCKYELSDATFLKLIEMDEEVLEQLGGGLFEDVFPYFRHIFPTKSYTKMKQAMYFIIEFFTKQVEEHKATFDKNNLRDLTDFLILARKDAEAEENAEELDKITDVHIRQTVIDLFFAGIETSRFTLYWAILYLMAHPEIQTKCQEEIDSVISCNRMPKVEDKVNLPFIEATLHEVMRIRTVAPLGVPHAARKDTMIGKFEIPKGMPVFINHWSLHMDPTYWPEPEKFSPYRFLNPEGKLTPKPDAWLPFSAGRRVCLGETIAKPELVIILAALLQHFTFSNPCNSEIDLSPSGTSFSIHPNTYKVLITARY